MLHDIDAERLSTATRMAEWTAKTLGATPHIEAHLDRRDALKGADFVVNTIQVGGARATHVDFDVPARYGLQYTINDTINVGGVFRGLRTIPVVLGIVRDMEEVCPDAQFLNYTNPMSMLVWAVAARSQIPTVGLCHSVYWTVRALADYIDVPWQEIEAESAGVNHLAFLTPHRAPRRRTSTRPSPTPSPRTASPTTTSSAPSCYRRLGYWPTESSEHHAEYNPWFIGKGDSVERYHIPIGEYLRRVDANLAEYAETKRKLDAGEPFEIEQSGEYAAVIVHSMVTGQPGRIVGNVMNTGLIPNLPADACVEVPCLVDGLGVHPTAMAPLPAAVRGLHPRPPSTPRR